MQLNSFLLLLCFASFRLRTFPPHPVSIIFIFCNPDWLHIALIWFLDTTERLVPHLPACSTISGDLIISSSPIHSTV
ncbi:unnamed protein product [Rhodiola kirilowii]